MESKLTLIELLLSAGVIDLNDVAKASSAAQFFGRQPGALLADHIANTKALELAVNLMTLVNSGRMRRVTAVGMVKLLFDMKRSSKKRSSTAHHNSTSGQPMLGELLCQAGLLTVSTLASALLTCEMLKLRLGQYLVLNSDLDSNVIQHALELQKEIGGNVISIEEAASRLAQVQNSRIESLSA